MFKFLEKESIGTQLVALLISLVFYVVLMFAYYDDSVQISDQALTYIWHAVTASMYSVLFWSILMVRSFMALTYEASKE